MKTALILGGGFAGVTAANMLKEKGFSVTVLEKSGLLGGGCRTYFYFGHPFTYGPHHLLVDIDKMYIYEYMSKYLSLRELEHYNMTYIGKDDAFYTYPIHQDDIELMSEKDKIKKELEDLPKELSPVDFEDYWKNSVGETLYDNFINTYSKKMWDIKNNKQLDEFTFSMKNKANDALKSGSKKCFDDKKRVFYPTAYEGYNSYFDECVKGCRVLLNTPVEKFDIENKKVWAGGQEYSGDIVINTLSPDIVFDYCYGELPYMGRDFLPIVLPIEKMTPEPYFFIHYANDEAYTRVFEYKLLTGYKSPNTLIVVEFPSKKNKLYPYPIMSEINKAKKYISMMPDGVYSIGRNGNYHYDNMDVVIRHCMEIMKEI